MTEINRRDFIRFATVAGASLGFPQLALAANPKVVVVGGGVGGCTAAKYLRKLHPQVDVTLIETKKVYQSCFMSNEVLSGDRTLDSITFDYEGLKRHGVKVVIDRVDAIEPDKKQVVTQGGETFAYDACIVSPGVDFKWDAIEGYDEKVAEVVPHAWFAGPQTTTLRNQILAMPEGGKVIIVAPPNPYKCPPGPYERAAQIAMYCKHHKPKAKILILDPKDKFSKQGLFTQGWSKLYGFGTENSMIEWVGAAGGGTVEELDPSTMTLQAEIEEFQGDVINIIPPQKAGKVAFASDLTDGDWCPVNKLTFESSKHKNVYVLGDASSAAKMPKSAYAANSQAKVAAAAIVSRFNGIEPPDPTFVNTCYSILGEEHGISVAAVYTLDKSSNTILPVKGAGGLSPMDASDQQRKREVSYAHSWFANLIDDMMM
ncbi:MAG: FCSD flavin-binding domain-containing protein [Candidatus Thiodiazotropha lotti]|uniref:FCSD flavin-binding domain-containing protein n=1 Tax=Candidatus Thiodiazotropha endoloripes TaxID=1818881 RepID=UPI00083D3D93|nr:FCSD flavin-binding domain-containing protein [Candidatus Thiodiazotropha endoloripes]MCG7896886.1 FCSD flavin-binding domain-containing protein [Candidatus Thiodiazotropha weberae]MCG7993014.1 FCSD flavin-binding domain-containing protein [Candidatus Thiodiazotropha lotti]MCG7902593.1 FCSD flavin-binding domain-containing protein [Candidatus Thiodiazotropha weberae]MCG8000148.1 FCSD flavin-binding domain-containing protein [Candidatus Thiodiazotropha lotti]MCW4184676.1 FCSD flavin-binding 